jgi:hypothetical protein
MPYLAATVSADDAALVDALVAQELDDVGVELKQDVVRARAGSRCSGMHCVILGTSADGPSPRLRAVPVDFGGDQNDKRRQPEPQEHDDD